MSIIPSAAPNNTNPSALSPEREAAIRRIRADELRSEVDLDDALDDVLAEVDRLRAELAARPSRAEVLHEAAEVAVRAARACGDSETGQYAAAVAAGIGKELRRMADEAATGGAS